MPIQKFDSNKNVVDAAKDRIGYIFDQFETIIVSISGGKDSTVLAHLSLLEAYKRDRKIGLFFLDEEVVYQSTVDQIEYLMSLYPNNTNRLWLQIEFYLTNATSLNESQLKCWEAGKHKIWMRSKGKNNICAKPWDIKTEKFKTGYKWLDFYGAIENFQRCYKDAAFLVGLRAAGESPNRWRAVTKNPININGDNVYWGTKKEDNFVLYPIYDWNFHDVWKYIYENKLRFSKVYDWQFKKGFGINEMRVSSLIHERSFKSLCELPEFEPKTYNKLLKRIKGIAFAQEAGKNSKMFRVRKLPKNFKSWIAYREFLLETYPDKQKKEIFTKRFSKHLVNEFVCRQQCRALILNDYENNLPIINNSDPRDKLIEYYRRVL
ncbi:MAG: phosphoadenosine phosphosulfate reductase domain-containing protein [Promethearchaeota archaeon]